MNTQTKPVTTIETLTALVADGQPLKIALSDIHNAQIVQPVVLARLAGRDRCKVVLSWHDHSDNTYSTPETFSGRIIGAEQWLIAHKVRLDAQGIY